MYPKANFVHLDDSQEPRGCDRTCAWDHVLTTIHELPAANSTLNTSFFPSDRTVGSGINSSFFQRSFRSNSTSKGCVEANDDECDPECRSGNETHPSPRSCNRPNCTNPSCRIVTREPSPNGEQNGTHPSPRPCNRPDCTNPSCRVVTREPNELNTVNPSQNESIGSHLPRFFRAIGRSIGLGGESTPRPDCDLECSNVIYPSPPRGCERSRCHNSNCGNIPSPVREHPSHNVGHYSHIPRSCVPKPSTYNIPSFMDRTVGTEAPEMEEENLFGLVRLKENDVCYTSGTIEWVGRKRTYPVNSGFKTFSEMAGNEPLLKKVKKLDKVIEGFRECECVEMLPTVNAIVDHLNALHQAVDLIDLRLNTVEDTVYKD